MKTITELEKEQLATEERIRLIEKEKKVIEDMLRLFKLRKEIRVKNAYMPKYLLTSIKNGLQGVSSIVIENIEAMGIRRLYEFAWSSEEDLKIIKGIDDDTIEQIRKILEDYGIGIGHLTPLPFLSVPYTLSSIPNFYIDYDSIDLEYNMLNIWTRLGKYERVEEYVNAQFYHYERILSEENICNNELVN